MSTSRKVAIALVATVLGVACFLTVLDQVFEVENRCLADGQEFLEGDSHPSEPCICDTFGDFTDWVCSGA